MNAFIMESGIAWGWRSALVTVPLLGSRWSFRSNHTR